jgi:hypothetical protein
MKKRIKLIIATIVLAVLFGNVIGQNYSHQVKNNFLLTRKTKSLSRMPTNIASSHSGALKMKQNGVTKYQLDSLVLYATNGPFGTPNLKMELKYDSLGRMVSKKQFDLNDTTNLLELSDKMTIKYGNNYCQKEDYYYNSNQIDYYRNKIVYDTNGTIQYVQEGSDSINFENTAIKFNYLYINNLLTVIEMYYSNQTTPSGKTNYYYDSLNRDTAEVSSHFNGLSFIPYNRIVYTYDTNNNKIKKEEFQIVSNQWKPSYKTDNIFENQDCISSIESYLQDSIFIIQMKYVSIYNRSILNSDIYSGDMFTNNFPYTFQSQLKQIDLYGIVGDSSILVGSYNLYYSESNKISAVQKITDSNQTQVKYNSAAKRIEILNASGCLNLTLNVYNTSGVLLMSNAINAKGYADAVNLAKGIYIYKLIGVDNISSDKFIVE